MTDIDVADMVVVGESESGGLDDLSKGLERPLVGRGVGRLAGASDRG